MNALLYTMGDKSDDILSTFDLSAEEMKKYEPVKMKFDGYFVKKRNVTEPSESVDGFVTDLYALAKHCNYGTLHDELIRDRFVSWTQRR